MDEVKLKAVCLDAHKLGLGIGEVVAIIAKWGPVVLNLIVDGLKYGLTWAFMKEILEQLGIPFLEQAINSKKDEEVVTYKTEYKAPCCSASLKVDAPIIEGEQVDNFDDSPIADVVLSLILKYLPVLFQKYGPQILDAIIKFIIDSLTKPVVKQKILLELQ